MKTTITVLLAAMICIFLSGCVQKSYTRTLLFSLSAKNIQDIKNVGIRGNDNPFSWEHDFPMTFDAKDSTYKAIATMKTGYLFTEIKFSINGKFELQDQPNRKLQFNNKDTIHYNAAFDVRR